MKHMISAFAAALLMAALTTAAWASPLTGDTSRMGLWIAMMAAAAVVLVVVVILAIRNRKK